MFYEKARVAELIAKACRILGHQEMTYGALGHVSYRLEGDTMLIKGKGPDEAALSFTAPRDIIEIDFDGEVVDGPEGLRAPSECFIHAQLFKSDPAIRSVIHCHPEHAILLTIAEREIVPIYGAARPGLEFAIDGVPTYPRSHTITTPALADALVATMGRSKVALMRGHGITVAGSGVEDATVRALAFNELLTMTYKAWLLGDPHPLPDEDIEDLRRASSLSSRVGDGAEVARRRGTPGGEASMLAAWRYYCGLASED